MGIASETGQAHITAALTRAYADVVSHDRGTWDDRRMRALGEAVNGVVAASRPYRACVAADVLQVSEKTVRRWASEGILEVATTKPRLTLTAESVTEVLGILDELRELGRRADLTSLIWYRLQDRELSSNPDLALSLKQMRERAGQPAE